MNASSCAADMPEYPSDKTANCKNDDVPYMLVAGSRALRTSDVVSEPL